MQLRQFFLKKHGKTYNMKSDLQIHYITPHTPEWHAFRRNGIGGSEVGDICGLVKAEHNRTIYHFHNKVGDYPTEIMDNPKMFAGRFLEDKIAELWEFWDGTEWGYIDNYKNNKKIRSCRSIKGMVINPKYPWLFGSVDRLINKKGGYNLLTGEPLKQEGILEIKNMSFNASRMWEDFIPPSHIAQVHTYMIIFETDYAELVTLVDGNQFSVIPFNRDESFCESIINVTKAFWYNRAYPAQQAFEKKKKAEMTGNVREYEEQEALLQRLEPDPDSSNAYREFMNESFLKERESIPGTMGMYEMCKQDKFLLGIRNIIDDKRGLISNTLIKELTDKGAEVIDFGSVGKFLWRERRGSKNRVPKNLIKEKPTEEQLMKQFKKIDLNSY